MKCCVYVTMAPHEYIPVDLARAKSEAPINLFMILIKQ